jgi:DNA repair protein RadC
MPFTEEMTMTTLFVCDGDGFRAAKSEEILECAEATMSRRIRVGSPVFKQPAAVRSYLRLHLGDLPYEVFGCLYLDSRYRLIAREDLFHGTIDGCVISTREVIRSCILHAAASLVIYHNHPSGDTTPSQADERVTLTIKQTAALIDVRLLDHWIIGESVISMAELGLI